MKYPYIYSGILIVLQCLAHFLACLSSRRRVKDPVLNSARAAPGNCCRHARIISKWQAMASKCVKRVYLWTQPAPLQVAPNRLSGKHEMIWNVYVQTNRLPMPMYWQLGVDAFIFNLSPTLPWQETVSWRHRSLVWHRSYSTFCTIPTLQTYANLMYKAVLSLL